VVTDVPLIVMDPVTAVVRPTAVLDCPNNVSLIYVQFQAGGCRGGRLLRR
jgi:hypothetical protein